jgi:hypothetical protein
MLSTSRNVLWLMKNITVQIEIPYHMHASSGARLVPCAGHGERGQLVNRDISCFVTKTERCRRLVSKGAGRSDVVCVQADECTYG